MVDAEPGSLSVNRRGLFLGAGVAALATGLVGSQPASAAPSAAGGASRDGAERRPAASPITTSIASAPISGYTYRSVCMYDFEPFNPAAQKTWGGSGIYSAATATTMRATVEIPPGALVRDVEFYVSNTSGSAHDATVLLYVPGRGTIQPLAAATVPSSAAITATLATLDETVWGPYPSGSRLLVGMSTPTDSSVQINGARIGMTQGAGALGLLLSPQRVYDSRATKQFATNETRTITLPASALAPGTTGVLVNVTAVPGTKAGHVTVWPAGQAQPAASSVNFQAGANIANAIVVGVSAGGQIRINSSAPAHVIVDLSGTVS